MQTAPIMSGQGEKAEAPPETEASNWTRRFVIAAFWAVIVFIGLPHWIQTTSIHRSSLPLERMNDWAEGRACDLRYRIPIAIHSTSQDTDLNSNLANAVLQNLQKGQSLPLYDFHVDTKVWPGGAAETLPSITTTEELSSHAVHISLDELDLPGNHIELLIEQLAPILRVRLGSQWKTDTVHVADLVAQHIQNLYAFEQDAITYLLHDTKYAQDVMTTNYTWLEKRDTRAFKYGSNYHLTFSMFAASGSPTSWSIQEALDEYIAPLLNSLSTISSYTVNTQVQLYASFSPSIAGPKRDAADNTWKLQQSDLSGFINAAEWPLSPSIGSGPTINFVLYVPAKDQSPMVIAETGGTSWIIPQWGGVQIFNQDKSSKSSLETLELADLRPVMLTWGDQLASLLGVHPGPGSLPLRVSTLTRERATSLILSASSTLGALARLTLKLTSIAIPDSVAKSVDSTIYHLDNACHNLRDGNLQQALDHARTAEEEAEKAFFEPSMVGQVYFPEEHKVAVYVPLLGPMAVPLIMSAVKELRSLRRRSKVKSA